MKRTRHTPEQIIQKLREADAMLAAILIMPAQSEQGYRILTRGDLVKDFVDFEGLTLPKTPRKRP